MTAEQWHIVFPWGKLKRNKWQTKCGKRRSSNRDGVMLEQGPILWTKWSPRTKAVSGTMRHMFFYAANGTRSAAVMQHYVPNSKANTKYPEQCGGTNTMAAHPMAPVPRTGQTLLFSTCWKPEVRFMRSSLGLATVSQKLQKQCFCARAGAKDLSVACNTYFTCLWPWHQQMYKS